jgi:hypothetical protein
MDTLSNGVGFDDTSRENVKSSNLSIHRDDAHGAIAPIGGEEAAARAEGDGAGETFNAGEGLQQGGCMVPSALNSAGRDHF